MTFKTGDSLIHRLHPAVKLAWLLWATVAVFVSESTVLPVITAMGALALLWLSGAPPWRLPGLRLLLVLTIAIIAFQAFFVCEGDEARAVVSGPGLHAGLRAAGRLLTVLLLSGLFVRTTEPVSLSYALMHIGLPYRWGFALVTALRLAPLFRVEAHHVYRAQLVRGIAYDARGPRRWYLVLRHLCLPLLVSALLTAHSLSLSMEGRAFGLHRHRTYLRRVVAGPRDLVAGVLLVITIAAAVWHGL